MKSKTKSVHRSVEFTLTKVKARALAYLSQREHSRAELRRKLIRYTADADGIDTLLDALEREGWLSASRFAESLVYRRTSRFGANRIINELKQHALDDALIQQISEQLHESEGHRAKVVWGKKYATLPNTSAERAKQARFLAMRGFSYETITKLLNVGNED